MLSKDIIKKLKIANYKNAEDAADLIRNWLFHYVTSSGVKNMKEFEELVIEFREYVHKAQYMEELQRMAEKESQ